MRSSLRDGHELNAMTQENGKWLRRGIGGTCAAVMWAFYFVRVAFGTGPMHDLEGNQSPAIHYLGGALVVTAMVAAWIIGREWWERKHPS